MRNRRKSPAANLNFVLDNYWRWERFSRRMTLYCRGKNCSLRLDEKPDPFRGESVALSAFEERLLRLISPPLEEYFQGDNEGRILEIMIRLRWVKPRNIKDFSEVPTANILAFPGEITPLTCAKFGTLGEENSDVFVVEESRNQHHSVVFLQPWKQVDALSFLNVPNRFIHSVEVPKQDAS
jgi:hypothetical protein